MGGDVGGLELADNGLELGDPLADLHISGNVEDLGGLVDNQDLAINPTELSSQTMEDFNADLNALHIGLGAQLGQKQAEEHVEAP